MEIKEVRYTGKRSLGITGGYTIHVRPSHEYGLFVAENDIPELPWDRVVGKLAIVSEIPEGYARGMAIPKTPLLENFLPPVKGEPGSYDIAACGVMLVIGDGVRAGVMVNGRLREINPSKQTEDISQLMSAMSAVA